MCRHRGPQRAADRGLGAPGDDGQQGPPQGLEIARRRLGHEQLQQLRQDVGEGGAQGLQRLYDEPRHKHRSGVVVVRAQHEAEHLQQGLQRGGAAAGLPVQQPLPPGRQQLLEQLAHALDDVDLAGVQQQLQRRVCGALVDLLRDLCTAASCMSSMRCL